MMNYNRRRCIRSFVLILMLSISLATKLQSTIIHVPSQQPTIQAGIDTAIPGDTVLVADGLYTGDGNRDINVGGRAITIISESGPSNTIIDCQGTETEPHRGYIFNNDEDSTTVITGFTITNGDVTLLQHGGAVFCDGASPMFENCRFVNNRGGNGGAIYSVEPKSNMNINNCVFLKNTGLQGGAVYHFVGEGLILKDCDFIENSAAEQAAVFFGSFSKGASIVNCHFEGNVSDKTATIYIYSVDPTLVQNCTFIDNSNGPTVFADSRVVFEFCEFNSNLNDVPQGSFRGEGTVFTSGASAFYGCTFKDNKAMAGGGIAVRELSSSATIDSCFFVGNSAGLGGGLSVFDNSVAVVTRSVFAFNTATARGGAIHVELRAGLRLSTSTLSNNRANIEGGAVSYSHQGGGNTIRNCIISYNQGQPTVDCNIGSIGPVEGTNMFGNVGGDWAGCLAEHENLNANFSADPLYCDTTASDFGISVWSPCAPDNRPDWQLVGALPTSCGKFVCGDANADGLVNTDDLSYMIEFYFAFGETPHPPESGDSNCDSAVDLSDLVFLASYLNANGAEPCCLQGFREPPPRFDRKKKPEQIGVGSEN